MVCSFDRGRMACMVRLHEAGNFAEKSSEEVTHEGIAIQTIHRQFYDADEQNLLEEADMHVFDAMPLTDPLHLVCCNACGKPVKASQFAAHEERCKSISSKENADQELYGGADQKKPSKKGRQRIQLTNGREKQKSESAGGDSTAASEFKFKYQNGMLHSVTGKAQTSADHGRTIPDASTNGASIPGPLAMKVYHPQGSYRLRKTLGYLYQQRAAKEHSHDSVGVQLKQDKAMLSSRVPYANISSHEVQKEDVPQTKSGNSIHGYILPLCHTRNAWPSFKFLFKHLEELLGLDPRSSRSELVMEPSQSH
ncbi:uncharacterized protein LOC109823829 isoform X3 [Asparagus officinalis]|uniref:uncharacterized protein LOC109823829 isoform X3 n=1 Tax=Asparagus officinalis TaxID=4686 RepID=UPI00098E52AC|nr:uncharacterized protein LOC109823829 isoform X3 [Asparagus officinalis]